MVFFEKKNAERKLYYIGIIIAACEYKYCLNPLPNSSVLRKWWARPVSADGSSSSGAARRLRQWPQLPIIHFNYNLCIMIDIIWFKYTLSNISLVWEAEMQKRDRPSDRRTAGKPTITEAMPRFNNSRDVALHI